MFLAVDTSIGTTLAVVAPGGTVLAEASSQSPRGHAEVIGDLLVAVLSGAGVAPDDVTHVVAGMGPGPFTGLRIGIAAARTFAVGRGLPIIAVRSHDAPALARIERTDAEGPFAIVTDARRRENAVSVYDGLDGAGLPRLISGPELHQQSADLAALLPEGTAIVPTAASGCIPSDVGHDVGKNSPAFVVQVGPASDIRAADLGRVAARMVAAGVEGPAEPLYLRSPDVSVNHARKRVST